jgi:hypothetical protein
MPLTQETRTVDAPADALATLLADAAEATDLAGDSANSGGASPGRVALKLFAALLRGAWRCAEKVLSVGDCHVH